MNQVGPERRRYFRVADHAIVAITPCDEATLPDKIAAIKRGEIEYPDRHRLYLGLDAQFQAALSEMKDRYPEAAACLDLLNRKVNVLAQGGGALVDTGCTLFEQPIVPISLSACGLSGYFDEPFAVGQAVNVELVLQPDERYLFAIGRIASSQEISPDQSPSLDSALKHYLALEFIGLRDEDLEYLIRHVMRVESARLKQNRQQSLEGGHHNSAN